MEVILPNEEFTDNLRRALVFGQVNRAMLLNGDSTKLYGNAKYPASDIFILNFRRAIDTGTVTNAQIAAPNTITGLGTYAKADESFVLECNRAGLYDQLDGIVT